MVCNLLRQASFTQSNASQVPLCRVCINSSCLFYRLSSILLLTWLVTLVDFQKLRQSCIPGIDPTWTWSYYPFYIVLDPTR